MGGGPLSQFVSEQEYSKLFEADGIAYQELCDLLVHYALERHEAQREFRF